MSIVRCTSAQQTVGGELSIPDGWFVSRVDADCDEPYIEITNSSEFSSERKLPMPKALAYYLRMHYCGSHRMHKAISENAVQSLQYELRQLLGIKEE